jgi:hypothetical protein
LILAWVAVRRLALATIDSLTRWVALTRYQGYGDLPADKKWIPNRIRLIALGREACRIVGCWTWQALPDGYPSPVKTKNLNQQ